MHHKYALEIPEAMRPTATVFAALGDPFRQQILLLFEPGESLSIKEIANLFDISRTAVVHHLNVLERAGILAQRRQGKAALYTLQPETVLEAVMAVRDYILEEYLPQARNSDER